ncbi:serine/threonine-protein kinase [Hyalangium minutum]|uniref:Serine/threonine kinase Pkn10 n=1 Tax=Hyalangium minutum TaxID=394096 RepID=A0A085WS40_9BACT|nr:serine/threonine-protein kinase [Hyalangium minutum]KFE70503.1 Serine/threonine kinase Pkn10 [Hyalangium minutum]
MITQACPNCARTHDVSVYVSGQRLLCRCGIRFEVRRNAVSTVGSRPTMPEMVAMQLPSAGGGVPSPQEALPTTPGGGVAPPSGPLMVELDVSSATVMRASEVEESPRRSTEVDLGGTFVSQGKVELPGYELLEVLGRGGMGEVWLARQRSLERTVAVKLLPPRLAKDPEFVTRFEKEATALAALSHPNIIQIIDRGVAGEHYYFAMEYVEGRSLRELLGLNRPSAQQGLRVLLQVSRAIEYAHEKGIIHRDLKPENILVDARGHAKVADFGLAGIRRPDSRLNLTATAVAMGTLNYMAPEQRRDAKNVDGRADLFSLGVMAYEVLTGELPVGRFRMPSERVQGLDPRVDEVVARLLENEPDARYATAGEVCAALEAVLGASGSGPALAPGSSPGAKPEKSAASSVAKRLHTGWRSVRTGLSVVGGLILLAAGVRLVFGTVELHVGGGEKGGITIGTSGIAVKPGKKPWPANTDTELYATSQLEKSEKVEGLSKLTVDFVPGEEEMNAWSGTWRLEKGTLRVQQGGSELGPKGRFLPRTYVAHRYFSSDDFTAEVEMDVRSLGPGYLEEPDAQHFGELTYRIRDLQVSAFAIPDVGMRLSWRYIQEDGEEVVGNSSQDLENLTADEMPVPAKGPFKVRLQLKRRKNGVMAEAFVNNVRFAYKMLHGLEGRAGKVALGCRNLECNFSHLTVQGMLVDRPKRKVAGAQE